MRALSTKVLVGTSEKKKIYPANYVESDNVETETSPAPTLVTSSWVEDEECDYETINYLAGTGDPDANIVQDFERDLEEAMQEIPDLQQAMVSYLEARQRITEKKKYRQFWPSQAGGKSSFKGFGKKRGKGGGKASLLDRITKSFSKISGKKGHWKAECPDREKEQANTVISMEEFENPPDELINHVIIEEMDREALVEQNHIPKPVFIESPCIEVACVAFHRDNQHKIVHEKAKWVTTNLAKLQNYYAKRLNPKNHNKDCNNSQKGGPFDKHHRSSQNLANSEQTAPVCLMSSEGIKEGSKILPMSGMAILDTGASRSVVGEDHIPWIMKQLPDRIRVMVKERDSRVGFRFGNNQIEYSFKQLQIPLIHGNQRVWILIEVVPRATPFLISIHTMKCLKAVIDLESGSCFLKSIGRSIPIIENKNGLMTLKIQDLCCVHSCKQPETSKTYETCAAAFSEFKSCKSESRANHSLTDHANSGRDTAIDQGSSRGSDGDPPTPPPGLDEPIRGPEPITRSVGRISLPSEHPGERSPESKGKNRTVDDHGSGHSTFKSSCYANTDSSNEQCPSFRKATESTRCGFGNNVRTGMGNVGSRRVCGQRIQPSSIPSGSKPSKSCSGRTESSRFGEFNTKHSGDTSRRGPPPANLTADQQLALTHMTMESWRNKRISWGKKHIQHRYSQVYEEDPQYITWLRPRQNLNPAMSDFLAYSLARENLEAQAGNLARQS